MPTASKDKHIVEKAVQLSLVEFILGSFLHGLRIPLSGHFLSLNQSLFLTRFIDVNLGRGENVRALVEISFVTSTMKALSPAGKKLGPMISISTQGILYSLGILVFGINRFGQIVGACLSSLWAFCQPLVSYFLIYGTDLVNAFDYYLKKLNKHISVTSETLLSVLLILIGSKLLLAALVPFVSHAIDLKFFKDRLQAHINKNSDLKPKGGEVSTLRGVVKDLTKPLFLLSLFMMMSFFYFTGEKWGVIVWRLLRAISIACLLFYEGRSKVARGYLSAMASKNSFLKRIGELAGQASQKLQDLS